MLEDGSGKEDDTESKGPWNCPAGETGAHTLGGDSVRHLMQAALTTPPASTPPRSSGPKLQTWWRKKTCSPSSMSPTRYANLLICCYCLRHVNLHRSVHSGELLQFRLFEGIDHAPTCPANLCGCYIVRTFYNTVNVKSE